MQTQKRKLEAETANRLQTLTKQHCLFLTKNDLKVDIIRLLIEFRVVQF